MRVPVDLRKCVVFIGYRGLLNEVCICEDVAGWFETRRPLPPRQ